MPTAICKLWSWKEEAEEEEKEREDAEATLIKSNNPHLAKLPQKQRFQ